MPVSKKKDSPYYYTRFSYCGVRVQESTRATTRQEAQRYEDKRRQDIREQFTYGNKPKKTWLEAERRFLEESKHKRSIRHDADKFEYLEKHFSKLYLHEIDKEAIENVAKIKEKEGSFTSATINRMLALIKTVLNKAYKEWDWVDKIPHIRMRSEENSRIRWLTKEEANRLLGELPEHLKAMAEFTLNTGLRLSNVSGLKWSDIDQSRFTLVIRGENHKNRRNHGVYLNEQAMSVLRSQQGKHSVYVFSYKGRPVINCNTRAWRKALERANIEDFRWHDLRHTWASWHVQNGTSLQELQQLGGWSSFDMVLRYAHLSQDHLRKASENIREMEQV
jgi:integrase